MAKRFVSIWFRHLTTDWLTIRQPVLKGQPVVFAESDHGRMVITATNTAAEAQGIGQGMAVADARAVVADLQVFDEKTGRNEMLLKALGEWCIRYSPIVAVDLPDGLVLNASGCTHLWGGEREYLKNIVNRLRQKGYDVRVSIADTIGAAWANARFGKVSPIIEPGAQGDVLRVIPSVGLRLEPEVLDKLHKLGLYNIGSFMDMPRSVLRRRFGYGLLLRINQALDRVEAIIEPLHPIEVYESRLPCLEPIRTRTAIEIAIKKLLEMLCFDLKSDGQGIRTAVLKCFRLDGRVEQVDIGTNRPTYHISHLFKLFELKIGNVAPGLGIELFVLTATKTEDVSLVQEAIWAGKQGLEDSAVAELLDRVAGKVGVKAIHRYLPDEHFWPEKSIKQASSLKEEPAIPWPQNRPRPTRLLSTPEPIDALAAIPDYPPKNFIYRGKRYNISKADGPERIEREWWMDEGEHRDYYVVEDDKGCRYWLFRLGHYSDEKNYQWFIHGFFA
jgi:protein ImuB